MAWSVAEKTGAELCRAGGARVSVAGEVQSEALPHCRQLGESTPLEEPLGGVLGFDPELVTEHLCPNCRRGEADHRTRPVL